MSTELATNESSSAEIQPLSQAGATLERQVLDMAHATQLAEAFANTSFAGPFKGKPKDLAVAILKGNSLGIPAHEVGGKIYTVHGTPALYGKTALAIAKAHGYRFERLTYGPEEVSVKITSPNGDVDIISYTFARAEKEGLVKGNSAQYNSRPEKMLWWKVIGEAADQVFPHLTAGMPLKEDWEQSAPIKATAERVQPAQQAQPELEQALTTEQAGGELDTVLAVIAGTSSQNEIDGLEAYIKDHLTQYPGNRDAVVEAWKVKKAEFA